jgi:rhamnosyltransferase subunit B
LARFLLTTFGSLGDLHPYIAVGCGLRARGHIVTIGTSGIYRSKIEGEGLLFRELGPDVRAIENDPDIFRRAMHPRTGTEYVFRQLVLPRLETTYEDTVAAARDADLIVSHGIAFPTPIAAEVLRKRWISVALAPAALLSSYDPPQIPGMPLLNALLGLGPRVSKPLFAAARRRMRRWGEPVNRLRKRLGLREVPNPLLNDMYSPYGTQAWFSRILAEPQPDWPPKTFVTGFPFYDLSARGEIMGGDLARFLESGPAPVVFTLGSSAVMTAGNFYVESTKAAQRLGVRAVLLIGRDPRNKPPEPLPETIFAAEYAPHSELLPRAIATVHQGGVGTTAQALRAGKPMLVVPFSHDQPDNAKRVVRIGAGRTIPKPKYRATTVEAELSILLGEKSYAENAARTAAAIANENGVETACGCLQAALSDAM